MGQTNNGELKTLLQLLKDCTRVVIPKIQRDYAQGRIDPEDSNLCKEVREDLVATIQSALLKNKPLILDYVYGSSDSAGFFYPIDGQQRMTTLFLLYWYISVKENRIAEIRSELRKFTYEIRDTAKEFCISLLDISFDAENVSSLKEEICNSNKYYISYNDDPTVQAMLVMLEKLHEVFKNAPDLFDRLNNIQFWVLSLEHFGLTDDLFVKMNARGKRLSRFDTFKSELESALDKCLKENPCDSLVTVVEKWKQNIDNAYLDNFWPTGGKDFAERNIYRTIMLFVNCMIAADGRETVDTWEANDKNASYRAVVNEISNNPLLLEDICNILGQYDNWKSADPDIHELLLQRDEAKTLHHYTKVRLFGVLYWWAKIEPTTAARYFSDFYRILSNYVISNREYAIRPRQYQSSIAVTNIDSRLSFIKTLVDNFKIQTCDFHSYIKSTVSSELAYEREKLNCTSLDKIIALENCQSLRKSIHNFFFDNFIYIEAPEVDTITQDEKLANMALRIILSFSNGTAGIFQTLAFDDTTNQSGRLKFYFESDTDAVFGFCHKLFLKSDNAFGDKVMTVEGKNTTHLQDLEQAVKSFAKCFHSKYYGQGKSVEVVLQEILQDRLLVSDFTDRKNILWYIVKYPKFFYNPSSTTFYVLRRKHYDGRRDEENIYAMRCVKDTYLDAPHYNPFYLETKLKLEKLNSKITICSNLHITGNHLEYRYPCILSNGWRIRILDDGSWEIAFNNNIPNATVVAKYGISGDNFVLTNCSEDCIELICRFIMECN